MSDDKAKNKLNFVLSPQEASQKMAAYNRGVRYDLATGAATQRPNPIYGADIFNPNSYLPSMPVTADPTIVEPIPQGRFIDPNIPSPQNAVRMQNIQDFRGSPAEYVAQNAPTDVQEQSLMDRGKSMLANLFDYQDDADLSILGVPLGFVESAWDRTLRHMVGFYDLLNVGFGGLISAAPGGVQTISYDDLSGGKSVLEVLNGEMEPGTAPSPGQIAVTSIGLEAKRIREGNARLSDVLLANPATGPFILAALAADTSPLQADGFDLLNQQQRDAAFNSGWEKWMTGVTDAGLAFADPLIGVGVGVKVARAGMLGARMNAKSATELAAGLRNATNEALAKSGANATVEDVLLRSEQMLEQQRQQAGTASVVERLMVGEQLEGPVYTPTRVTSDMRPDKFDNPLTETVWSISEYGTDGNKVMDVEAIRRMPEIAQLDNAATVADLLYKANDPIVVGLLLETLSGVPGASKRLQRLRPALADAALRVQHDRIDRLRSLEPTKQNEVIGGLENGRKNATDQLESVRGTMREMQPEMDVTLLPEVDQPAFLRLQDKVDVLEQTIQEQEFLIDVAKYGKRIDPLDATTNPFYDEATADLILNDIFAQDALLRRVVGEAMEEASDQLAIQSGFVGKKMGLLYKENAVSSMARASRRRRARAAYEYAQEGTRIIPRRVEYAKHFDQKGNAVSLKRWEGVWTPSKFASTGTGRLQRNLRVWRWLGEETPSGYIGLKGMATVGSEREFAAAINLDLYKGEGIAVTRDVVDEATGVVSTVTETIGGGARQREMYEMFYEALNDPAKDSLNALQRVEEMIAEDFARLYGIDDSKKIVDYVKRAGKLRDKTLEQVRRRGYFVDPDTGDIEVVPYLKSHLANGTYMLNFQAMEKELRTMAAKEGGVKVAFRSGGHLAAEMDRAFQNVWRPLALMRFSYTQRNVFEGLIRAMAYNASLAPLTWPVRATTNGVRNAIVKRAAGRKVAGVRKRIEGTEYGRVWDNYTEASREQIYLTAAVEETVGDGKQFTVIRRDASGNRTVSKYDEAEYEALVQQNADEMVDLDNMLREAVPTADAALKGTKYQTWRETQIADINEELAALQKKIDIWTDFINDPDLNIDQLSDIPEGINGIANILESAIILRAKQNTLLFRPIDALADYKAAAGRQKRIGSGTSLGADGNYYGDAFTSAYDQLNRDMLSADNTVKQTLGVDNVTWANFLQRTTIKHNVPVDFMENPKAWSQGVADAIEDASSNALVRVLIENNWDEAKALAWLMADTGESRRYTDAIAQLAADGGIPSRITTEEITSKTRRMQPYKGEQQVGAGTLRTIDRTQAEAHIREVSEMVQKQMMASPEFYRLLTRRAQEKSPAYARGLGAAQAQPVAVTGEEILALTNDMSDVARQNLGLIIGSEAIVTGTDKMVNLLSKMTSKIFHVLGTVPEDAVVRGPFYNTRFKAHRNVLIEEYWRQKGINIDDARRANKDYYKSQAKNAAGATEPGTLAHAPFQIEARELSQLMYKAHRRALQDTREYMYTIERRTNVGKYGEWIFPFISASQNSAVVAGKLLYKEPWLAPAIVDLWRMPSRVGFEDENGNLMLPMPFEGVRDFLAEHPEIPFLGGAIDSADSILIPKDGLNVFMPDTGFGIVPRPVAWVQVSASEMMKAGAFPVETPQILRDAMGDDAGDQFYQMVKDYVFGTEGSMSAKTGSYDLLTPPMIQRFLQMRDDMDAGWGYQYQLQRATQWMRYKAGERDDPPTHDEINKRTTNMFWFQWLGNMGVPTPMTPYPILTRPQVRSATQELVDVYQKFKQSDPQNASLNMSNMFGDWGLEAANTKITANIGGADPTQAAASDIKTFDGLIRKVTGAVSDKNYDLVGILVNNRSPEFDYDQSAYNFEKATRIAGTSRLYREVQSPEESQAERERIVGWTEYRKGMDFLDAQLASRGLKSYEAAGARDLKDAKDRMVANMANNPELQGWWTDFQDVGGSKTQDAVRVVELAVTDETFVNEMLKAGKENLVSAMNEYVRARQFVVQQLTATDSSINDPENTRLKFAWATIRQNLKNSDERWAAIADRYFANDDNPRFPGNYMVNPFAQASVMGVGNA